MNFRILVFFSLLSFGVFAQSTNQLKISVSADKNLQKNWKGKGRLVLYLSKSNERPPLIQGTFSSGRSGFALNVENWNSNEAIEISAENTFAASEFSLDHVPNGKWFVQAVYSISEVPDLRAAGNFYSEVAALELKAGTKMLQLKLNKTIKKRADTEPENTELVKYITLESKLLSDFWGKQMNTEASILLPKNFKKNGSQKYPLRINIGGYGSSWTRASRLEKNKDFIKWWLSEDAPDFIQVFLNGANGPFGDPYYLDSENNGSYGSALTQELIPYIEKKFNAVGSSDYRFLDGCSTGGWVSFALQVFYPDYFNGCWSFSADPVDFNNMQLVNMYKDKSAFTNAYGYVTPSVRSRTGQPRLSIKDEVAGENLSSFENTYTTAGGQWGGWNALYSPKGKDGKPVAAFHLITGEINTTAVKHWENYDLLKILQANWSTLGPKLQGKIWVWMGDMDEFYLNNAMREMDKFLKSTTNPKSDAIVNFEATKGHCEEFDQRWVLEMMQEKVNKLK